MKRKYEKIYEDMIEKLKMNVWPPSSMLPSENDLTRQYQTSRETIRKVLNLLSQNGYIQKIHGKGSVVLDLHEFSFPVSGIVSFKELAENLDVPYRTIVQLLERIDPKDEIHDVMNVRDQENVWHVSRIREIDNEKVILDKDYFKETHVPMLTESICADSIYEYLEGELGLTIAFAEKEIVVDAITQEDRALLDVEEFFSMVVITSKVYLDDASLFQYTESRHRPDKFRFVDFARRYSPL